MESFRQRSRREFQATTSHRDIDSGSLQRIADALEKIAENTQPPANKHTTEDSPNWVAVVLFSAALIAAIIAMSYMP